MLYTNKYKLVLLQLIILLVLFGVNKVNAQTETPPVIPTNTPWTIFQWPTYAPGYNMCTPTPGLTPTYPFATPPPSCGFCEHVPEYMRDQCYLDCAGGTPTPGYTQTPGITPTSGLPTQFPTSQYNQTIVIDSIVESHMYEPYIRKVTKSLVCSPTDATNRMFRCVGYVNWASFNVSYRLISGTGERVIIITGRIIPYDSDCEKAVYVSGTWGTTTDKVYSDPDDHNCPGKEHNIYGSPITADKSNVGINTEYNRSQFKFTVYTHPQTEINQNAWIDFYIGIDRLYIYDPTPTVTPSMCNNGIPTPDIGGGSTPPIVWFNPPITIPGACYTVIPSVSLSIPEYIGLPVSISVPGFGICLNYLQIQASLFGISVDWMLTFFAFLMAAGLLYREIAS